jgi:hypothetical protein
MAADAFGLFKLCYVENSPHHSSEAARASGGLRGIHVKQTHLAIQGAVLWGVLASELHREPAHLWRPQGYPSVKIWSGHFLPVPTAVRSLEERAARRQFLCPKSGRDRRRTGKASPSGHTAWQDIPLHEKGLFIQGRTAVGAWYVPRQDKRVPHINSNGMMRYKLSMLPILSWQGVWTVQRQYIYEDDEGSLYRR